MAGVPESVAHVDGGQMTHEEVRDHLMTVSVDHDADSDSEHHHQLHLCSGGVAIPSEMSLNLTVAHGEGTTECLQYAPIHRSRTQLRPPIT